MCSNQQEAGRRDSLSKYQQQFCCRSPSKLPTPRLDDAATREPSMQHKRHVVEHDSSPLKEEPWLQHHRRVLSQRQAQSVEPSLERWQKLMEQYRTTLQLPLMEFSILGPKNKEVIYFPRYLRCVHPSSVARSPILEWDPDRMPPTSPVRDVSPLPAPKVVLPKPQRTWSPEEPIQDRPEYPQPAALPAPVVASPHSPPVSMHVLKPDAAYVSTIRPATVAAHVARKATGHPSTLRLAAPAATAPTSQRIAVYPAWPAISCCHTPRYETEYQSQYRPPDPFWIRPRDDVSSRVKDMRQCAIGLLDEHVIRAAQESFAAASLLQSLRDIQHRGQMAMMQGDCPAGTMAPSKQEAPPQSIQTGLPPPGQLDPLERWISQRLPPDVKISDFLSLLREKSHDEQRREFAVSYLGNGPKTEELLSRYTSTRFFNPVMAGNHPYMQR